MSISFLGQHYGEHRGSGTPNLGASVYRNRKIGAQKRMRTDPWAFDDKRFNAMVQLVFPKLRTNKWQLMQAARWDMVLRLYFRGDNGVVWTARLIAEQLSITTKQVQDRLPNASGCAWAEHRWKPEDGPETRKAEDKTLWNAVVKSCAFSSTYM